MTGIENKSHIATPTVVRDVIIPTKAALEAQGFNEKSEWYLNGLDHSFCPFPTKYSFRFNGLLDPELMKKGMQMVVDECPQIATQLRVDTMPYRFTNPLRGVDIAVQEVRDFDYKLPDENSHLSLWKETGVFGLLVKEEIDQHLELPMLCVSIQLYPKQKVTLVAICAHHALLDGFAAAWVWKRWNYFCNKISHPNNGVSSHAKHDLGEIKLEVRHLFVSDKNGKYLAELPKVPIPKSALNIKMGISDQTTLLKTKKAKAMASVGAAKHLYWVEVRFDIDALEKLKNKLINVIKQTKSSAPELKDADWFSRFELCMGIIYAARNSMEIKRCHPKWPLPIFQDFNGRRLAHCSKVAEDAKLGNGLYVAFLERASPELLNEMWPKAKIPALENVAKACAYIHHVLRKGFAAEADLAAQLDFFNISHYQYGECFASTVEIEKANNDEQLFFNAWANFPWLDVNFGCSEISNALSMARELPSFGNYWLVYQSHIKTWAMIIACFTEEKKKMLQDELRALQLDEVMTIL